MQEISREDDSRPPASEDAKRDGDDPSIMARRRELKRFRQDAGGAGSLRLREGLRVEELDDELVVLDASGEAVHRVTNDGVAAVRLLEGGVAEADIPSHLIEAVEALAEAGLVSGRRRLSRRKLIAAGSATWAAATVTTFALADPAAAWSTCRNGKTPTPPDSGSSGKKYTTAGTFTWTSGPSGFHTPNTQQSYNVLVRAWGGGGGGGDDGGTYGAGGGGGGAYAHATISVLECTAYTVVVGSGGSAGTGGGDGVNGGASTFKDGGTLKAAGGGKGGGGSFGSGGSAGAGGTTANSAPASGTLWKGGNGSGGGSYSATGCGGGSGGSTGAGGNATGSAGGAAGSGSPGGAKGGNEQNNGSTPGGGGGGDGGNGARGEVWVGV